MWTKLRYLIVAAFLVVSLGRTAAAELVNKGPIDSTDKFPQWYQDGNGLALELCLPPGGNCLSDSAVPGNAFSATIGFGEKAFYWSASADLMGVIGAVGSLKLALVASFSGIPGGPATGGIPADGKQIVFFQMTLGPITGLTAGNVYRVIHPYGVIENLVANSLGTIPRQSQDIGCATTSTSNPCDFNAVLGSPVGPFLQWDTSAPIGFIGNPATAHTVVGSPFGTNVFRIEGPNAGGTGTSFKETDLFKVQGKILAGTLPTPLTVDRSTYTRPSPPQIEVLASSSPSASLTLRWTGGSVTMTPDGKGKFFARIFNPTPFPSSVDLTASALGKTPTTVTSDLVDIVTVTLAEFNPVINVLSIEATSSDADVPPTLTAVGFGNLVGGKLDVLGVTVPPAQVSVVSSAGGGTTAPVSVIARPLARDDTALTLRSSPVVIDVLGNDTAFGSGNSLDPAAVIVTLGPSKGGTSVNLATGEITYTPTPASFSQPVEKDSFRYKVSDIFTQESNEKTVTVTVAEAEVLTVTKAQFTRRFKWWQITGKSKTSAATTGKAIPGNKITVYLGPVAAGTVIGTATVNVFGNWSFSRIYSPVDPGAETQISVRSALGTEVLAFPITFR